jgi:hypothetical protein
MDDHENNARSNRGIAMTVGKLRTIAEFLVVALCTVTFAITVMAKLGGMFLPDSAGWIDFVEYWASGHQFVHHLNPYDAVDILRWERSAGFPPDHPPLVMPNLPWALPLVLPLSFVGARVGRLLWDGLLFASLVWCLRMIRQMHGFPKRPLHLLAYAFVPVISCLESGQITIFILLGLTLFLQLHRRHPFVAGASLWFLLLKPHLFLPFGIVLLLWIVLTRSYKILAGGASAVALGGMIATILDPHVWAQYAEMMRVSRVDRAPMFSISTMLRDYVYPHTLWLQCIPALFGCLWAAAYYWKHRTDWDWMEHGALIVLVSVLVTPYTWFMDQAVLVAALLHGAYMTRSRTLIAVLALLSAFIEIETFLGIQLLHSPLLVWTSPAWLLWYVLATKQLRKVDAKEPVTVTQMTLPGQTTA